MLTSVTKPLCSITTYRALRGSGFGSGFQGAISPALSQPSPPYPASPQRYVSLSRRNDVRLIGEMGRVGDFTRATKRAAILRQRGVCGWCGVALQTPWSNGELGGYAHHLRPLRHGGDASLDNCVYLCWGHHQLIGHGMAPYGIDAQGGSSDTWVQLEADDFEFWRVGEQATGGHYV